MSENKYEAIRRAAETLLAAGIKLGGVSFECGGIYPFSTPDEVAEHVAQWDRDAHEYVTSNLKRIADAQKNGVTR